jgi:acyl-CoA thioesterase-1
LVHVSSRPIAALVPLAVALALALACGGTDDPSPAPGAPPVPAAPGPAATPQPARIDYVALGDSAGFGVGALPGDGGYPPRLARRIEERGTQVDLVNLSIPGATAREVRELEVPAALPVGAELVTVCIGGNDANAGRTPQEFRADLDSIYGRLATLDVPVVVCNVPDLTILPASAGKPATFRAEIQALNAEVAAAAAPHGFLVVDLFSATASLVGRPELVSADGFHPTAAGYEEWAAAMFPAVQAALGLP